VFGSKTFDRDWVGSIFCCSDQVRLAIFGLVLGLENFPLKIPNFPIFSLGVKKLPWVGSKSIRAKDGLASYLLRAKVCSGRVGLGPISSLHYNQFSNVHLLHL